MKKKLVALISLLAISLVAFVFAACGPVEEKTDIYANSKDGCIEVINEFLAESLQDINLVAEYKSSGEVQYREHVVGTTGNVFYANNSVDYTFIKDGKYYYAHEDEDNRYFVTGEEGKEYYDSSYCTFLGNVRILSMIPENAGVLSCEVHIVTKNGQSTGSLTFSLTATGGVISATASAVNGKVTSIHFTQTMYDRPSQNQDILITLTYGQAQVTIPDVDTWNVVTAEDKEGSIELIEDFFGFTLSDDNLTVEYYLGEVLQYTEEIINSSDKIVFQDGTTYYTFIKDDDVVYAYQTEDEHYYYKGDDDADLYYAMYHNYFMGDINSVKDFDEEAGTFTCKVKDEYLDGVTTSTLTFNYVSDNESFSISATAIDYKVITATVLRTSSPDEGDPGVKVTLDFTYGVADFEVPDLDEWDREDREKEERAQRRLANEVEIAKRDAFFSETLAAENVIITCPDPLMTVTETIADGVDYVVYGTTKTYTYEKSIQGELHSYYLVDDGESKYYYLDSEYYAANNLVYYNSPTFGVRLFDALIEDVVFTCTVDGDAMTFSFTVDDESATVSAVKNNGLVTQVNITVGSRFWTFEFSYGDAVKPDFNIADFQLIED